MCIHLALYNHPLALRRPTGVYSVHCKNVRVIITSVWSSQLHLFRGFYYTRMITVYKPHIEILIATFCFQNWWSRTAKALQSWETPNRCNSDNHSNFKMTLTFLQCIYLHCADILLDFHLISRRQSLLHHLSQSEGGFKVY